MQILNRTRGYLLLLGYHQITGILGIGLTALSLYAISTINAFLLITIFIAFGLYGYSIYCGTLLVRPKNNGVSLSQLSTSMNINMELSNLTQPPNYYEAKINARKNHPYRRTTNATQRGKVTQG